jgi:zinc protease
MITRLANGVHVVVVPRSDVDVASVAISVAVGSRDEPQHRAGFAHLFEHLMFAGSAGAPAGTYASTIHALGGRFNASTRADCTVFHVTAPAEAIDNVIRLEADRFSRPVFTAEALTREVSVVANEIEQRFTRRPFGRFPMDDLRRQLFARFANRHDGAATVADLPAATLTDIERFFEREYAPGRLTVAVVGGVDVERTRSVIAEAFSPLVARAPRPPRALDIHAEVLQERAAARPPTGLVSLAIGVDLLGDPLGVRDPTGFVARGLVADGADADEALTDLKRLIAAARTGGDDPLGDDEVRAAGAVLGSRLASGLDDVNAHAVALATRVSLGASTDFPAIAARFRGVDAEAARQAADALTEGCAVLLCHDAPRPGGVR